mmetsp:Transcript_79012/g.231982  ORF Transcript_79012/g.231982 Transcript_79012/m.231982 type:complete len:114 (+) Transcript_79012:1608-1949(+)
MRLGRVRLLKGTSQRAQDPQVFPKGLHIIYWLLRFLRLQKLEVVKQPIKVARSVPPSIPFHWLLTFRFQACQVNDGIVISWHPISEVTLLGRFQQSFGEVPSRSLYILLLKLL